MVSARISWRAISYEAFASNMGIIFSKRRWAVAGFLASEIHFTYSFWCEGGNRLNAARALGAVAKALLIAGGMFLAVRSVAFIFRQNEQNCAEFFGIMEIISAMIRCRSWDFETSF